MTASRELGESDRMRLEAELVRRLEADASFVARVGSDPTGATRALAAEVLGPDVDVSALEADLDHGDHAVAEVEGFGDPLPYPDVGGDGSGSKTVKTGDVSGSSSSGNVGESATKGIANLGGGGGFVASSSLNVMAEGKSVIRVNLNP